MTKVVSSRQVTHLLDKLSEAKTIREFAAEVKQADLDRQDWETFEAEISRKPYKKKFKELKTKAFAAAAPAKQVDVRELKKRLEQKKTELQESQAKRIAENNAKVETRLSKASSRVDEKGGQQKGDPPPTPSPGSGGAEDFDDFDEEQPPEFPGTEDEFPEIGLDLESWTGFGQGTEARVEYISPAEPYPGLNIQIHGEGFGEADGRIYLDDGTDRVRCIVWDWCDSLIECDLPGELTSMIGETPKDLHCWLFMPDGGSTYFMVTVYPFIGSWTPVVRRLSHEEIQPGERLTIEGEHFLSERQGTIEVRYNANVLLPGTIRHWSDTEIVFELDAGISGLTRDVISLAITNHVGRHTATALTFAPIEVIQLAATRGRTWGDARCTPCWEGIYSDPPWGWCCMFGEINSFSCQVASADGVLPNDWTIEEAELEISTRGVNSGAYWERRPVVGATDTRAEFAVWADGYSWAEARAHYIIRGPRGVPYY